MTMLPLLSVLGILPASLRFARGLLWSGLLGLPWLRGWGTGRLTDDGYRQRMHWQAGAARCDDARIVAIYKNIYLVANP